MLHALLRCALALAVAGVPTHLQAQARTAGAGDYPSKPVRWMVGFAPGASNDIIARLVSVRLAEALGQQVVVDNRSGAGGLIAGEIVAKATPDGHTLLLTTGGPSTVNPQLVKRPPYRVGDFAQIITIGYTPFLVVAHPSFPPRNPRELIDYLKANPGKVNWGSSGTGGSPHYGLLVMQAATGVNVTHVPYKGSAPALVDILAGNIQAMHTSLTTAESQLNAKRLKAIGVTAAKRLSSLPDVPTFAEQGIPNTESVVWFGLGTSPGTPRAIVLRLNAEVNRILKQPEVVRRFQELGLDAVGGTSEEAEAWVKKEAAMVAKLIQLGTLKPEQ